MNLPQELWRESDVRSTP